MMLSKKHIKSVTKNKKPQKSQSKHEGNQKRSPAKNSQLVRHGIENILDLTPKIRIEF